MTYELPPMPEREFTARFLRRMPADVASSFTAQQLEAIQLALGMREGGTHWVDARWRIPTPWGPLYFVFQLGPDRRGPGRLASRMRLTRGRHS